MTPEEYLMFLNRWIVNALDSGDTDALKRHIAKRNEIMDLLRLRDEPVTEREAA